jgi:hypothetical protein
VRRIALDAGPKGNLFGCSTRQERVMVKILSPERLKKATALENFIEEIGIIKLGRTLGRTQYAEIGIMC